jgi:hypothetical protein
MLGSSYMQRVDVLKANGRTAGAGTLMAEGSLSFDFYTRPVPLNVLLANTLRGAPTGDNLSAY